MVPAAVKSLSYVQSIGHWATLKTIFSCGTPPHLGGLDFAPCQKAARVCNLSNRPAIRTAITTTVQVPKFHQHPRVSHIWFEVDVRNMCACVCQHFQAIAFEWFSLCDNAALKFPIGVFTRMTGYWVELPQKADFVESAFATFHTCWSCFCYVSFLAVIPSRELTYPTMEKGKSSSKVPAGMGYATFQEGMFDFNRQVTMLPWICTYMYTCIFTHIP